MLVGTLMTTTESDTVPDGHQLWHQNSKFTFFKIQDVSQDLGGLIHMCI